MQLEAKKYLYDMQQAAKLLTDFTFAKNFGDYRGDPMLRSAVERQFEIIGEALAKLAKLDPVLGASLTDGPFRSCPTTKSCATSSICRPLVTRY